jgi:hypothetical protein
MNLRTIVIALPMSTLACSGNSLQGSLVELVPDIGTFQQVEVAIDPGTTLAVSYFDPLSDGGAGRNTFFKIAVDLTKVTFVANQTEDLTPDFTGLPKARCSRAVAGDPRNNYAPIKIGQFTVNKVPVAAESLSGSFRVTLGAGGDVGEGRSAYGNFTSNNVVTAVGL